MAVAFASVGYMPAWLFLLPLALIGTIVLLQRRGWLPIAAKPDQFRKHLWLQLLPSLWVALAPVLFLVYYLSIYFWGAIFGMLLIMFSRIAGVAMTGQHQENLATTAGVIISLLCWILIYWGFQTLALKRMTGAWHRPLYLRAVGWTIASIPVAGFVAQKVSYNNGSLFTLSPLWPILVEWILNIFIVSQLGGLIGQWLAQPDQSPIQKVEATSP